jgi:UPF0271 protein
MASGMSPAGGRIDFNCDLGEGCGGDADIVPLISSASIACGGHAGDDASMRATIALCLRHGVAVGAHPSFEDRAHFGRRELAIAPDEVEAMVARQLARFAAACIAQGAGFHHVKPHGALYNLAARDAGIAEAIASAVRAQDPALVLYALSGSTLARAGEAAGLRVAHEVFAERRYEADGSLTPRTMPGAVIVDVDEALAQVRTMLEEARVGARTGDSVPIRADTVCLHGDRADAPAFARALHDALVAAGVRIAAPGAA